MICELCNRKILTGDESNHHLVPKSRGGRNGGIVMLHEVCHKQVHALFTDRQLSNTYNTVEKLKDHHDIQRFVKWVRRKPLNFNVKIRMRKKTGNK